MRPSFTTAAPPEHGRRWFDRLVELARAAHPGVETGRFGAHMEVQLVNDGPVTFWLDTADARRTVCQHLSKMRQMRDLARFLLQPSDLFFT